MFRPVFAVSLFSFYLSACGQILTPAAGGTDYAVQGDYAGTNTVTGAALGGQVVALGSGNFSLLLLDGGLPGAGWDKKGRRSFSGSLQSGAARFAQSGFTLSIDSAGNVLQGTSDQGETLRLDKVHRQSPSRGQAAPSGAIVLFDGTSLAEWNSALLDSNQFLRTAGAFATGGAITKKTFRDFTLHMEFYLPFEPSATGQNRGNSGIYLQNRYEIQILDSYGLSLLDMAPDTSVRPNEAMRQCGAIWEQSAPDQNMAFPPLSWQTYDIEFKAARFDSAGKRLDFGFATVLHNGVAIHTNRPFLDRTVLGDTLSPAPGPNRLQEHGHAVLYRNIWIVEHPSGSPVLPRKATRHGSAGFSRPRYALNSGDPFRFWTPNGRRLAALPIAGF